MRSLPKIARAAGGLSVLIAALVVCSHERRETTPAPGAGDREEQEILQFQIQEGNVENHFYRRGPVAAHLVLSSGRRPRVVVAFPAGNGGVACWFRESEEPIALAVDGQVQEAAGRAELRGITAEVLVEAPSLEVDRAVLGSVRVIRDAMHGVPIRPEMSPAPAGTEPLRWARETLDGGHHYEMTMELLDGASARVDDAGAVTISAAPGGERIRLRLTALSDDEPLTPIPLDELLRNGAGEDIRTRHALAFLAYDEKLLAGSWRFLTYFGRDTLISTALLMPVAGPRVIEAGLASVLERLGPDGEVPHEEEIGEFAVLRHLELGHETGDLTAPLYDSSMIDSHFLLAPVAARYLLHTAAGQGRASELLARRTSGGETLAEALRRNLELVVDRARPFAESPEAANLITLEPGRHAGNWRDSAEGLGGGRTPYDVNVVLVPAALAAAAELYDSGLLGPFPVAATEARELARAWDRAAGFFRVELPRAEAEERIRAYAAETGVPADEAIASLPDPVVFPALALDGQGQPIPVIHSDEGFALLLTEPPEGDLTEIVQRMTRPFPAGLITPVGLLVSNPALVEDPELRAVFGREYYHGVVVWPWQQVMALAGVRRQLGRDDLTDETRSRLREAERVVWAAIEAGVEVRTTELWTWEYDQERGRYDIVPFGQGSGHRTESNAAQLWSTVQLALTPP